MPSRDQLIAEAKLPWFVAFAVELHERDLAASTSDEFHEIHALANLHRRAICDFLNEHPEYRDQLRPAAIVAGVVEHNARKKWKILARVERVRKYGNGRTLLEQNLMMKPPIRLDTALASQAHVAAVSSAAVRVSTTQPGALAPAAQGQTTLIDPRRR